MVPQNILITDPNQPTKLWPTSKNAIKYLRYSGDFEAQASNQSDVGIVLNDKAEVSKSGSQLIAGCAVRVRSFCGASRTLDDG